MRTVPFDKQVSDYSGISMYAILVHVLYKRPGTSNAGRVSERLGMFNLREPTV